MKHKLRLFLKILNAAGGETDASDSDRNWINYFCDDAEPLDTFNQASKGGYIRVTHDDRFDSSTAYITDKGREALGHRQRQ